LKEISRPISKCIDKRRQKSQGEQEINNKVATLPNILQFSVIEPVFQTQFL
jgi:hypothetical protein